MTLCVAAACKEGSKPRIVIATDWRAGNYIAGADIQDKLFWLGPNIAVLIAGNVSRAMELKNTYFQYFDHLSKKKPAVLMTKSTIQDIVKIPVVIFKRKLADEYVGTRLGMSYKKFLTIGNSQLPASTYKEMVDTIRQIDLDCCLILAMFIEKEQYIFRVDDDGSIETCENFAAIGSGSTIAEGVFYQREHESHDSIRKAIYHVYEAMKLGSIAPQVGEDHTINILYPQGERGKEVKGEVVTAKGMKALERHFKKFGPKFVSRLPRFFKGCLAKDF